MLKISIVIAVLTLWDSSALYGTSWRDIRNLIHGCHEFGFQSAVTGIPRSSAPIFFLIPQWRYPLLRRDILAGEGGQHEGAAV